ncbi:helix-turn-helix domain-containing protein [Bacteroides sp.]|uniref:helix-turn-helix domain-containing protein n=1 Tax=Bacteroides sp. TaxID=29523 RepID=UPI003A91C144
MENERNLMTTTEAARYLGLKPSYLYKMMMRRAIPYYKPNGKLCFFAREDLDAWLKRVRVKSQDEINSEAARYLAGRERNK